MSTGRRDFIKSSGRLLASASAVAMSACGTTAAWPPASTDSADDFWRSVRAQFPLTTDRVYFNTAGLGPAPRQVLDAATAKTRDLQVLSETGRRDYDQVHGPVAQFLNADPAEIAFTRNATEGNSTVAFGLKLQRGDEVIFESHAHPGGSMPWMARQKEHGIKVRIFEPDPNDAALTIERIESLINPRTRVIQVSHITAPTGIRMPVESIRSLARSRNLWFHIDGAQSAGQIKVDLAQIGCDSYATSGHKWMCGPHGTGILYVRRDRQDECPPTEVGAYSNSDYELPDIFDYNATARRYEAGTRDAAGVIGLGAAVAFLENIGIDRIEAYGRRQARRLGESLAGIAGVTVLSPISGPLAASIVTFRVDDVSYRDVYAYLLSEHKFRCRVVTEQGLDAVRVSTHIFNSVGECDRLAAAVRSLAGASNGR